ncbi:MAG: aminotransferase class V-fold PLP-dependent enzyme [Pseudomonadota bacterium]
MERAGGGQAAPDFSKRAFGLPEHVAYLNCAQVGPLHETVRAAGERALRRKETPWRAIPNLFWPELETARALFAEIVAAPGGAESVAIAPSVSYAMAVAAANLPLRPGRAIVVSEGQFPSNHLIWKRKAEEVGGRLIVAPPGEDGAPGAGVIEAITDDVAIVACDPARWTDGARLDLAAIAAKARSVGAALVLDLTQIAGAAAIDLSALDPDFAAAPAYKWLLGPYAQGFLFAAERRWGGAPIEESGGSRAADGAYLLGARRFDMGEKAHYHLTPMTIAGLELVAALTPLEIERRIAPITERLAAIFREAGFAVTPKALRSAHIFSARPPAGLAAEAAQEALARLDTHVSVRGGALRISPHLWVDAADEARLAAALRTL